MNSSGRIGKNWGMKSVPYNRKFLIYKRVHYKRTFLYVQMQGK